MALPPNSRTDPPAFADSERMNCLTDSSSPSRLTWFMAAPGPFRMAKILPRIIPQPAAINSTLPLLEQLPLALPLAHQPLGVLPQQVTLLHQFLATLAELPHVVVVPLVPLLHRL